MFNTLSGDRIRKQKGIKIDTSYTRPDNTTAYTAGDVIGADWTFDSLGEIDFLYVLSIILRVDVTTLPVGMTSFKLHLYSANTAVQLADNAPMTYLTADKAKYLGTIDLDAPVDKGDFLFSRTEDINKAFPLTNGKIYARLETVGAYTPTASAVKTISLIGVGF